MSIISSAFCIVEVYFVLYKHIVNCYAGYSRTLNSFLLINKTFIKQLLEYNENIKQLN